MAPSCNSVPHCVSLSNDFSCTQICSKPTTDWQWSLTRPLPHSDAIGCTGGLQDFTVSFKLHIPKKSTAALMSINMETIVQNIYSGNIYMYSQNVFKPLLAGTLWVMLHGNSRDCTLNSDRGSGRFSYLCANLMIVAKGQKPAAFCVTVWLE